MVAVMKLHKVMVSGALVAVIAWGLFFAAIVFGMGAFLRSIGL